MKPRKDHPWRVDVRGVLRFTPLDGIENPVRILSADEIRERTGCNDLEDAFVEAIRMVEPA